MQQSNPNEYLQLLYNRDILMSSDNDLFVLAIFPTLWPMAQKNIDTV